MSVAPFLPATTRPPRTGATDGADPRERGTAPGFGAELAAALGTTPADRADADTADGTGPGTATTGTGTTTDTTDSSNGTPGEPAPPSEQDALLLAALAGAAVLPTTPQTAATPADAGTAPDPSVGPTEVASPAAAATSATTDVVPGAGAAPLNAAAPGTTPAPGEAAGPALEPGDTAGIPGIDGAAEPSGEGDLPGGTADDRSSGQSGAPSAPSGSGTAPATNASAPSTATPAADAGALAGPQPATAATGARPAVEPPAPTTPTTTVLRQVFPEITRVAAGPPGTHRIALTLNPESLGEVRVTVMVRAGEVQVSLGATTDAAQRALLEGSPELHRLLDRLGVESRVVVRDAAGPTQSSTSDPARGEQSRGDQPADGRATSYADGRGGSRRGWEDRPAPDAFAEVLDPASTPNSPTPASAPARPGDPTGRVRLDRLM